MDLTVRKQINSTTEIEVKFKDERDLKEAILKATPFMQASGQCGLCNSTNIGLQGRVTKEEGYLYAEFYCKDCGARQSFGEYKAVKGALFLKRWEKYSPQNSKE